MSNEEFTIDRRIVKVPTYKIFELPLIEIKPSQLYISEYKLKLVREWFDPIDNLIFHPIPVKLYNGHYLMTDGHTRAALATLAGLKTVPVYWDDDPLNMLAYAVDVDGCSCSRCDSWGIARTKRFGRSIWFSQ